MRTFFVLVSISCLSAIKAFGQKVELIKTIIPQKNQEYSISVEYLNDYKSHCQAALKYTIRKTGTFSNNTKLQWTFQHIPCGKTSPVKEVVSISIPRGTGTVVREMLIKTQNIITRYDENSLAIRTIEDPSFIVNGPASVMEGDEVSLRVESPGASKQVRWIWTKGNGAKSIGDGNSIRERLFTTTSFFVCAENEGFRSPVKEFVVQVIKRPDAPSDFKITGPAEITDIESANLSIKSNAPLQDVRWIWEVNNQKVGEGLTLAVKPERTTTYSVHSEYYWKKSPLRSFQLKVRVLPEAPSNFDIAGPGRINEGEKLWLKISNKAPNNAVKWIWSNSSDKTRKIADSILISPDETTTYEVYADLNGKISGVKSKTIEVIQLAAAPGITGDFKRCVSSTTPSRFTLHGGKLGTGSKNWAWYEGVCGSGKLIHTGPDISLSPVRTTSYYVQPDNNPAVCKQFTLKVGLMPGLPEKLSVTEIVCPNKPFIIEASGILKADAQWTWYAKDINGTVSRYKGEGQVLTDTLRNSAVYTVLSKNEYCQSAEERKILVRVKEHSSDPYNVYAISINGRHHLVKVSGSFLAPGSQWVWYKGTCNGTPLGYGSEMKYRASKSNHLYVRAEGVCDTTICSPLDFVYKKDRNKFFFVNLGLSSNLIYDDITGYNAQVSLGSNSLYLRAKAPISRFVTGNNDEDLMNMGVDLETDNNRITNYPTSTGSYYKYNGKSYNECYAVSGGFLIGGKVFKIYIGGGYSKRDLYWGADVFDYGSNSLRGSIRAKNIIQSISGPLAEGGIFLKIGSLNLMGGMSVIIGNGSSMYRDVHIGIGVNFKRK